MKRTLVHRVTNNVRVLVLRWIRVEPLASKALAFSLHGLSGYWEQRYGHCVCLAQTFVDQSRFRGTCYRAANWTLLGMTTGRGKDAPTHQANRSIKQVLGYALVKDFRERLACAGPAPLGRLPCGTGILDGSRK